MGVTLRPRSEVVPLFMESESRPLQSLGKVAFHQFSSSLKGW